MPDYAKWVSKALAAAGLGGAATVATPDDAEALNLGRLARTANLPKLRQAEEMYAKGAPKEDILGQTDWFQGADKKWRFYLPDVGVKFKYRPSDYKYSKEEMKPENLQEALYGRLDNPKAKVSDVFKHPELYKAYPELGDIGFVGYPERSVGQGTRGFLYDNPVTNRPTLALSDEAAMGMPSFRNPLAKPPDPNSIMLHELQHGIQSIEGFSPGGSMSADPVVDYARRQLGLDKTTSYNDIVKLLEGERQLYEGYKRLAGETEARNAQRRYDYLRGELEMLRNPKPTPEQVQSIMRNSPPWATQDVADAAQILLPPDPYQYPFPFRFPRGKR